MERQGQQADAGEYSDPLSYVRLYASWLVGPRTHSWTNRNGLSFTRSAQRLNMHYQNKTPA